MGDLTLQFKCSDCGSSLEMEHSYPGIVKISPCEECCDKTEYDEGYSDGYEKGLEDKP